MTDLRQLSPPTGIPSYTLVPQASAYTAQTHGRTYTNIYTRPLWNGSYQWDYGTQENMEKILASINDIDNEYIVPLYLPAGSFIGNWSDFTRVASGATEGYYRSSADLDVGKYIQVNNYALRIQSRQEVFPRGTQWDYLFQNIPRVNSILPTDIVRQSGFYIHATSSDPFMRSFAAETHAVPISSVAFSFTEIV